LRLDDIVGQLGAFLGELIHALRISAAQDAAAIAAQFAHAQIIDMKEQDVWSLGRHFLPPS
jgi:hypothetical protein